jgi:hypothetical protein
MSKLEKFKLSSRNLSHNVIRNTRKQKGIIPYKTTVKVNISFLTENKGMAF